ncbi:MAG: hypothetical protein Q9199_006143 [Rusavskia elegans]
MVSLQPTATPQQVTGSSKKSVDSISDHDYFSGLSSAPLSPLLIPSSVTTSSLSTDSPQTTAAKYLLPRQDHRSTTPLPTRGIGSQSPSNRIAMLDDVANLIRTAVPWDRFTQQYGFDGPRFEHEVLTPLLAPLYRTASGDIDTFFNAALAYHVAKKRYRRIASHQERDKRSQEARDLRDYEKMRDKERWQVRKTAYKEGLREMKHRLDGMKAGKKSGPYKSLEAAIKRRKDVLVSETGKRQEEKRAAKEQWKIREAGLEGVREADCDDVL